MGASVETGSESSGPGAISGFGARSEVIVTSETDGSISFGTGSGARSDVVVTKDVHGSGAIALPVCCDEATGLNSKFKRKELVLTESSCTKGVVAWLGRDSPLLEGVTTLTKECGVGRDSPLL